MINREMIRLKVVQLTYSFYQNEGKSLDVAEKELNFSMSKAYELYLYLLSLLVEIQKYAARRNEQRLAREQRSGAVSNNSTDQILAGNKLLLLLRSNKALNEYIEISKEYSTVKSNTFVNGVLDRVLVELTAEGKIVKTGRGLM